MEDRIKRVMASVFGLRPEDVNDDTAFGTVAKWDSLQHMNLIVALEEDFHIKFDVEEITDLLSYPEIRDAVARRTASAASSA